MDTAVERNRKHPAHFAPVERFNQPMVVEVTLCTTRKKTFLTNPPMHRLLRAAWEAAEAWRVGDYTSMPDHLHLFCEPGSWPPHSLKRWTAFWRANVTRAIQGSGPLTNIWAESGARWNVPLQGAGGAAEDRAAIAEVTNAVETSGNLWQRDFWDTQMRHPDMYREKLSYVRMNPVRAGLVSTPEEWPYSGRVFDIRW